MHSRRNKPNPNTEHILHEAQQTQFEEKARVKIKSTRGVAGRLGLMRGDVVTHFQGEPWNGTADELTRTIETLFLEDPGEMLQLVVNADECTAEALRARWQSCKSMKMTRDSLGVFEYHY